MNINPTMDLAGRASPDILSMGQGPPYTSPSLTANLVLRVMLAIAANITCLVPLRILYRNGELAVAVLIVNLEVSNFITIINALLWKDDNFDTWWPGYGLCDSLPYIRNFTQGVFSASMLAILRHLANQVSLLRAHPLSVQEKRRRNLVQALIIFPVPLIQVALTWPLTSQRFAVGSVVGCLWSPYATWQLILFYIIPPVIFAFTAAIYAAITFVRFRQVSRCTESALSRNRVANMRAQRTRRRLYLMIMSILIPYLPLIIVMAVFNIKKMGPVIPFNYNAIHHHNTPYPWNTILFLTADQTGFTVLNEPWIYILTSVPVFLFFGMTKEAMNDYRKALLFLGLGHVFNGLNREYDPERGAFEGSSFSSKLSKSTTSQSSQKNPSEAALVTSKYNNDYIRPLPSSLQGPGLAANLALEFPRDPPTVQKPEPVVLPSPSPITSEITSPRFPLFRNPFLFRTTLDLSLPHLRLPNILRPSRRQQSPASPELGLPLHQQQPWYAGSQNREATKVQTRVWSQEPRFDPSSDGEGVVVEMEVMRESCQRV